MEVVAAILVFVLTVAIFARTRALRGDVTIVSRRTGDADDLGSVLDAMGDALAVTEALARRPANAAGGAPSLAQVVELACAVEQRARVPITFAARGAAAHAVASNEAIGAVGALIAYATDAWRDSARGRVHVSLGDRALRVAFPEPAPLLERSVAFMEVCERLRALGWTVWLPVADAGIVVHVELAQAPAAEPQKGARGGGGDGGVTRAAWA